MATTFYSEIAANKRNSFLLALVVMALLGALGLAIGYALTGSLSGVLGRELSHVRYFDIRFSLIVGVLVGSVALLAGFFLRYTFWFGGGRQSRDGEGRGGGAQAIVAVLAILLAIVAPIAAQLVQMAVSRQREYLADASSVELTRNPHSLERALATIASDKEVL